MSNSTALASLTATYTDSEGEEDTNDEETDLNNSNTENTTSPLNYENRSGTSSPPSPLTAPIRVNKKLAKLVSYHDDTVASDDDNEAGENPNSHEVILIKDENPNQEDEIMEEDGVSIPPEPPGHCSVDLQEKIAKYYEKMKSEQLDMNAFIEKRKDFRNPSIYEKLLQFCAINELGTNYPPSVYDPLKWSKESYYEELAKVQKTEIEKREKDRKNPSVKKTEDDSKKRKSKWDQPGGNGPSNIKPAGLVQPPTLTTNATGTKSTVISAFGSLPPKKPRM